MSYKRSVEDERRMKKTYDETKYRYGPGVWYDKEKGCYVHLDFTNSWLKVHSRRIVRRHMKNEDVTNCRGLYKKYFDYWWALY